MNELNNQLLELYMDEIDNIIEEAFDEAILFESIILEAEGDTTNTTTTVVDKVKTTAGNVSVRLKEMLQKLGTLLEKFIGALQRVGEIIKTKFANAIKTIEVFRRGGKVKTDFRTIKFDTAYHNANEISNIVKDMQDEIIQPVGSGQPPKNDSIDAYVVRYDKVRYNEFIKDDNNYNNYKAGNTINAAVLQSAADKDTGAIKLNVDATIRSKLIRARAKNLENKTGQEEASKDIKLFHTAATRCISMNQDINRYMTKFVGDLLSIPKNCDPIKAG